MTPKLVNLRPSKCYLLLPKGWNVWKKFMKDFWKKIKVSCNSVTQIWIFQFLNMPPERFFFDNISYSLFRYLPEQSLSCISTKNIQIVLKFLVLAQLFSSNAPCHPIVSHLSLNKPHESCSCELKEISSMSVGICIWQDSGSPTSSINETGNWKRKGKWLFSSFYEYIWDIYLKCSSKRKHMETF